MGVEFPYSVTSLDFQENLAFARPVIRCVAPDGRQIVLKGVHDARNYAEVAQLNLEAELGERAWNYAVAIHGPAGAPVPEFLGRITIDGTPFIAMEYIASTGTNLSCHTPTAKLLQAFAALGDSVSTVRKADIAHNDIKPFNVIDASLSDRFLYKIIDFGVSSRRDELPIEEATWGYASPQRLRGETDRKADVYGLAAMLYESLTGALPYGKEPRRFVDRARMSKDITVPSTEFVLRHHQETPSCVREVVRACLDPVGENRSSIGDFSAICRRGAEQMWEN